MKKLSKAQIAKINEFADRLAKVQSDAEDIITKAREAVHDYNEILCEVESWRDEIVSQIDDYVSERSEAWQESDAASAYEDWKASFEDLDLDELNMPDEPDMSHSEALLALDTEPNQ